MRVYLSGPMKGYPESNFSAFHATAGEHECHSSAWGAITVTASNGLRLGVRPAEFEPLEWRWNATAMRHAAKE